jgi:hypothetical protein
VSRSLARAHPPAAPSAASPPRERRLFRRYAGGLGAGLEVDGRRHPCRICDISLGGCGIEPALPEALGRPVRLESPRLPLSAPLTGRVVGTSRHGTHVAFALDPATERELVAYLAGAIPGRGTVTPG